MLSFALALLCWLFGFVFGVLLTIVVVTISYAVQGSDDL